MSPASSIPGGISSRARPPRGRNLCLALLCSWWLFLPGASFGETLRVPQGFATITAALAAAQPGDVVLVAPGTYTTPAESFPLLIDADVGLVSEQYWQAVLDAQDSGPVVEMDAPAGGRVSGFRITGGRAETPARGGGFRILDGDPEIDNNLIHDNFAKSNGSGIYMAGGSSPRIHHNVITRNFTIDPATGDAHGIQVADASGSFEHNVVSHHDSNGLFIGAVALPGLVVRHNVFLENGSVATNRGRGVCDFGPITTVIAHNIFHGNVRAAILLFGRGNDMDAVVANAAAPDDDVYGNLDGDPLLVNAAAGLTPQDFGLLVGSPAIDAGDPLEALDPDGTIADLGAFYSNMFGVPDQDGDFIPDVDDNCPASPNLSQADADGDGLGDACDAACSDGLDNDGDGALDHPVDPGCRLPSSRSESPACNDGIDNDGETGIDFDGGSAATQGAVNDVPDPQCINRPWRTRESVIVFACGLGFELVALLPVLLGLRRWRRTIGA